MTRLVIMYNDPDGGVYPLSIHVTPRSAEAQTQTLVARGYDLERPTTVAVEEMP